MCSRSSRLRALGCVASFFISSGHFLVSLLCFSCSESHPTELANSGSAEPQYAVPASLGSAPTITDWRRCRSPSSGLRCLGRARAPAFPPPFAITLLFPSMIAPVEIRYARRPSQTDWAPGSTTEICGKDFLRPSLPVSRGNEIREQAVAKRPEQS